MVDSTLTIDEFTELILPWMNYIYRNALRMTRNEMDADDLTQDTFLRAWRFFYQFEKGTNMKAWLSKISKNLFINSYRRQEREPEKVGVDKAEIEGELLNKETPEVEFLNDIFDDEVSLALKALPDYYCRAIILSDLWGYTYKETAKILECPVGTVMSRLHRGRKLLRDLLAGYARSYGYNL
ncbi:MAG: RNA polymerase sigma-70 factor, ECF subfamily [Parcubacteria group bacterium LiPW_72]|nr:MAG: RNA polymerase sigma-70 factor, ECF subfamily [Parcubacteria group bacterium LiPW_72]